MNKRGIPEELAAYVEEEAVKNGYVLVDIGLGGRNVPCIEVVLDKKRGITLDECARINRNIVFWIDERGLFSGKYTLDVCSPGLDRELRTDGDFTWAESRKVRVTTREPVDGKSEIEGKLLGIRDGGDIAIEAEDAQEIRIERDKIAKVRLLVAKRK
ncbi:MAG: ribosome maturation factor RimP [Candidatus Omnitrophica bacterium]|nr:ribosome maturation factor RimP [Candidatus Omnitrophota bacterium]